MQCQKMRLSGSGKTQKSVKLLMIRRSSALTTSRTAVLRPRVALLLLLMLLLAAAPPPSHSFHLKCSASVSTPPARPRLPGPPEDATAPSRPRPPTGDGRTAVVLNINARSVDASVLAPLAESIFGRENVFVTRTADEAREAAADIVAARRQRSGDDGSDSDGGYSLVVPVGGDGTLSCMINYLVDARMRDGGGGCSLPEAVRDLPLVGYVPMGTGNGVGSSVGCAVPRAGSGRGGGVWGALERFLPGAKRRKARRAADVMKMLREVGERVGAVAADGAEGKGGLNVVDVPMIEVCPHTMDAEKGATAPLLHPQPNAGEKGDLCFFAGAGFDSLMLDDFKSIKAWSSKTGIFPRALGSVAGYVVALVVKTLPKAALRGSHRIRVKLNTHDRDTLWVDHRRGDFVLSAVPDGAMDGGNEDEDEDKDKGVESSPLYEGTTGILAAGTSPFYGGGMRLFPFARLTADKMHLRLGRISPLVGFANIPKIFEGSYRERTDKFGVIDFIGKDFEVEVESECGRKKGYPFQHSGESMGDLERFRLRVVDEPVRFVNFMEGLVVKHD